ncbi:hypothetical protein [Nocardioides panacihumi]|uniref:hypothetical protein n=1 Tax=Nocardioides panacihumi TaxID=400774 RepID=UPI0031E415F1
MRKALRGAPPYDFGTPRRTRDRARDRRYETEQRDAPFAYQRPSHQAATGHGASNRPIPGMRDSSVPLPVQRWEGKTTRRLFVPDPTITPAE